MELNLVHFYPELMSLYGSYANVRVLARALEGLGHSITVTEVRTGEEIDLSQADFVFLGAGTERSSLAALEDLRRHGEALSAALASGTAMLFCGTGMELLGKSIRSADGTEIPGLGLTDFTVERTDRRIVGDVLGKCVCSAEPIVGFMNKCSKISGVNTPLLTELSLGFGNEAELGPEGFQEKGLFASSLTGPILVKNPRLLDAVVDAIYAHRGESLPTERPKDHWAEDGYAVTVRELSNRVK